MTDVFGERGRFLTIEEKCRLVGIELASVRPFIGLGSDFAEVAIGNSIPVTLVGSVRIPILCVWILAMRREKRAVCLA